jgi:16S rRNA (uracil1498-N3)-methyltransferase
MMQSEPYAGKIQITGRDFHYLIRVRRLKPGNSIQGLSPRGVRYTLTLDTIGIDSCTFSTIPATKHVALRGSNPPSENQKTDSKTEGPAAVPLITLYQSLPKGSKMDMIVRMAIEGGVSRIVPLTTKHSLVRLEGKSTEAKIERWQRIAKEAVQQSGASLAPQIEIPRDFSHIPNITSQESDVLGLFFHQQLLENSSLHGYLSDQFKNIALIVGPEGGFALEEVDEMLEKGYRPVYLGNRVLRTETAGIYALGAIQTIILERGKWEPVS